MRFTFIIFLYVISLLSFSQGTISDIDGNSYNVVKIGDQEWIAQNLRTTQFNDGTPIRTEKDSLKWIEITESAYCWYKNDSLSRQPAYGALYNWYAAQDSRLCPVGWRVATYDDYVTLIRFIDPEAKAPVLVSEFAGKSLKEQDYVHWPRYEDVNGSNATGFSAIGAGCRGWNGWYNSAPYFGYFWTAGSHWSVALRWATDRVFMNDGAGKYVAISVRCVRKYQMPIIF